MQSITPIYVKMADAIGVSVLNAALMGISNSAKAGYAINISVTLSRAYDYQRIASITTDTFKYALIFISNLSCWGNFMSLSFICVGPNYEKSKFPLYNIDNGSIVMSDTLDNSNARLTIASTTTAIEFYLYPVVNSSITINGCALVF